MNKSKILRAVLAAVLTLVATTATAHDFEVDGIYYNKNGDGTVSVTYRGNSFFDYPDEYTGDVVIPSSVTYFGTTYSVTSIGIYAFKDRIGLTSVTIPNSVTSIGYEAFYDCSGLKTIFYNAENCADKTNSSYVFNYGTNIIIGKDVKKVPNYLFDKLSNAPTSLISKSVTPPTCGANSFNSNAYTAKLYVPSGAIADYKAAKVWKKFTTIEGIF